VNDRSFAASYDEVTQTLSLSGIIDELSISEMERAVERATAGQTRPATVDLSGVDFLPSIGLGVLALAMRATRRSEAPLRLVTRRGTLAQRVLEISGLPFQLV
jgi:anti-anti-sigma factor